MKSTHTRQVEPHGVFQKLKRIAESENPQEAIQNLKTLQKMIKRDAEKIKKHHQKTTLPLPPGFEKNQRKLRTEINRILIHFENQLHEPHCES